MKALKLLGWTALFAAALTALPLAQAQAQTQALVTNHSGTLCHTYNAGEASLVDYVPNGARSLKGAPQSLICPVTRAGNGSNGAYLFVDVIHSGVQTTTCSAFSHRADGVPLAAVTQTLTFAGVAEFFLPLNGAGKSAPWGDYSVLCTVPGNSAGQIAGVDLAELL